MWVFLLLGAALAGNPYAEKSELFEVQPFQWTAVSKLPGQIELSLHIPSGSAVYRDQLGIVAIIGTIGEPIFPVSKLAVDPSNPEQYKALYDADVVIQVPATAGDLVLQLTHQGCRAGLCWPQTTVEKKVTVK